MRAFSWLVCAASSCAHDTMPSFTQLLRRRMWGAESGGRGRGVQSPLVLALRGSAIAAMAINVGAAMAVDFGSSDGHKFLCGDGRNFGAIRRRENEQAIDDGDGDAGVSGW